MGKVKVEITKVYGVYAWHISIPDIESVHGSPELTKELAMAQFRSLARRLRIPDDAWEFVEADNG